MEIYKDRRNTIFSNRRSQKGKHCNGLLMNRYNVNCYNVLTKCSASFCCCFFVCFCLFNQSQQYCGRTTVLWDKIGIRNYILTAIVQLYLMTHKHKLAVCIHSPTPIETAPDIVLLRNG